MRGRVKNWEELPQVYKCCEGAHGDDPKFAGKIIELIPVGLDTLDPCEYCCAEYPREPQFRSPENFRGYIPASCVDIDEGESN